MGRKMLTLEDIEVKKSKLYHNKTPISAQDEDIEKVLVSNKISFGEKNFKYFIGYMNYGNKVKPLHIMLPKTSTYVKTYNEQTKWMYFLTEYDDLLEKYNTIWDRIRADIKKHLIVNESKTSKKRKKEPAKRGFSKT